MRKLPQVLLILVVGACAAIAPTADVPAALTLRVVEPTFSDPEVESAEGEPGRFKVVLRKEMPTPGWSFDVDVELDRDAKRIRARVAEIPPAGITSQVLTPARLEIPLGSLSPGSWLLELWVRGGRQDEFFLKQAFVLRAQ